MALWLCGYLFESPVVSPDLVVRGSRVVLPGGVGPASVHVAGGPVARIAAADDVPRGATVIDAGDLIVMPGLVDAHVHVNKPGRTEWEGFPSATRAAAAGGVTTIVDMPLNSVPATVTLAGLDAKRRGPGCDWAVVRLGRAGTLHRIEIDTTHYKGNAPESCALEVTDRGEGLVADLSGAGTIWKEVLPRTRLRPHARHRFELPAPAGPATHARLSIFPDGGIARLRLFGRVSADPPD